MRFTPLTLEKWKLLGYKNTDNIYTRDRVKVSELMWHKNANPHEFIFSGLIGDKLTIWDKDGRSVRNILFHGTDLMIKVEENQFFKTKI
jgi:hypothetical protein